ncbi:hypothetical protein N7499_001158 [Penicillium canescens]|uniref:Zn(2)-C6 fungal-type domain-containing protein n=1 Tax=Penicillium canescens TaxID=5083 RepID=A0AAD6N409_PENCN|nr:uncharacterized protein N7446_003703 [Penicillium canescens]KAJ6027700.1 hypothetical protein N7460_012517 [Penicillium canescens]KAJ6040980.1 hypothetical protein N7444_009885 [Penicillium canescens]KAJ6066666.1 hypothetical protein N7446_003703 [Penicillium canescens]KAJ6101528.1 hypothetical protein N7499_001158 [Penicillium canescens]KAJ6173987.1 hypothetical protein N7485_006799 [Penicillium canescens]
MKVKQRTVCQTCRTRKLGCDGKQPECGQCLLRGRKCFWDSAVYTFLSQNARVSEPRRRYLGGCQEPAKRFNKPLSPNSQPCTDIQQNMRLLATTAPEVIGPYRNDWIESIMNAFVPQEELPCTFQDSKDIPRICGAWVGVLPNLAQNPQARYGRVLSLAIEALSSCVTSKPYAASIQTYTAALEAVRTGITVQNNLVNAEVVAAIMCLTLAELFFPESRFGIAMHVYGVARLFQASGPERFKSGVMHSLFAGFRPLFMLQAFQSRTATFISSNEWIRIPFSGRRPSLMQTLISQAAHLPSLLQQTDTLLSSQHEEGLSRSTILCNTYLEFLLDMERWEQSLRNHYPGSICDSFVNSKSRTPAPPGRGISFPDITMANVYTHLWAFRIICATELGRLVSLFPLTHLQDSTTCNYFSSRDIQEHNECLARLICFCMEYLVQDDFKLFGPTSAMLPLQTAYKVLITNEQKNILHVIYVKELVQWLVEKGIRSAPYVIY